MAAVSDSVPLISSPVMKVPTIVSSFKVNSVTSFAPIWNLDTASTNAVAPDVWPVIVRPINNEVSPVRLIPCIVL